MKNKRPTFPRRRLILLTLLCATFLLSFRYQPRLMLWYGSNRTLLALADAKLQFMPFETETDRPSVRPSITGWIYTYPPPLIDITSLFERDAASFDLTQAQREHEEFDAYLVPNSMWAVPQFDFAGIRVKEVIASHNLWGPANSRLVLELSTLWLIFPLALWLLLGLHRWRTARKVKTGLCLTCGYDLRASPDRCPECGNPVPPVPPVPPPPQPFQQRARRTLRRADTRFRRNVPGIIAAIILFTAWLHSLQCPAPASFGPITDLPQQLKSAAPLLKNATGDPEYLVCYDLSDLYLNAANSPTPLRDSAILNRQLEVVHNDILNIPASHRLIFVRHAVLVLGTQPFHERVAKEFNAIRSNSQ